MCMFNVIYLDHIDIVLFFKNIFMRVIVGIVIVIITLYSYLGFLLYHRHHHRIIICLRHKQSK